ncbi:hypothetical protein K502DRAFT_326571 [Neoconidiobolus thromboides FSU 785]|nr:hypothetical protein K502DRAFT_326571 [Neoconidiobolus thromboides FSU 785]
MDTSLNSDHYGFAVPVKNERSEHFVKSHQIEELPQFHDQHIFHSASQHQYPPIDYNFYPPPQFQPILPSNHNLSNSGSEVKMMNGQYLNSMDEGYRLDHYMYSDQYTHQIQPTESVPQNHIHATSNPISYNFSFYDTNNAPSLHQEHKYQMSTHSTPCNFQEGFPTSSPWMDQDNGFDNFTVKSDINHYDLHPCLTVKSEATHFDLHPCQWESCHEAFHSMEDMIRHVVESHIGAGRSTYECRWRGCKRECKPFPKRHKMLNHFRTHTGEKPFICKFPNCKKAFSRPDSLATHIKTHSDIRPYICPLPDCGRAYYHSRSLRKHLIAHSTRPTPYTALLQKALQSGVRATIQTDNSAILASTTG